MCFTDPSQAWQALTGQGGQLKPKSDAMTTTSSVSPPKAPTAGAAPDGSDNSNDNSGAQPSGGGGGLDSLMLPRTSLTPVDRNVPTG